MQPRPTREARSQRSVRRGLALLAASIALSAVLVLPKTDDPYSRTAGIRTAAAALRGGAERADIAQDYVGARAVAAGSDPYPILGPAFRQVGLEWDAARHRSPHPPSNMLLVLPLSWLDYPTFVAVWSWLMMAAIAVSLWALGLRAEWAPLAAVGLLAWQPAAWSVGQLTAVWLLGVSLAWRWRHETEWAGAAVAVAALTKFFGAVLLLPYLVRTQWRVLVGFLGVTIAVSGVLIAQELVSAEGTGLISRYLDVGREAASEQVGRNDNAALLHVASDRFGWPGLLVMLMLIAAVLFTSLRRRELDRHAFGACSWASVALLPIAWIYSVLPMLPALIAAWQGRLLPRLIAVGFVAVYAIVPPYGDAPVFRIALATAALGLALILATPGSSETPANPGSSSQAH